MRTLYFFVAQKVLVNHSKVFLQLALCAGGNMKISKEDRHDQDMPFLRLENQDLINVALISISLAGTYES